jgi:hypothetical protein
MREFYRKNFKMKPKLASMIKPNVSARGILSQRDQKSKSF